MFPAVQRSMMPGDAKSLAGGFDNRVGTLKFLTSYSTGKKKYICGLSGSLIKVKISSPISFQRACGFKLHYYVYRENSFSTKHFRRSVWQFEEEDLIF